MSKRLSDIDGSVARIISNSLRRIATILLALTFVAGATAPTRAGGLISDDEIEQLLFEYAEPILYAAGLGRQNIKVHIVDDLSFNAMVIDGRGIFIHAGALMESESPIEIMGVIAHEAGHITGAHLAQLRSVAQSSRSMALLCRALGIAAVAGGALAGSASAGQAGFGASMGCENMVHRNMLAYKRPVEAAADKAGVESLKNARKSVCGMIRTLERLADKQRGAKNAISEYRLTHPYASDRLAQLRGDVTEDCDAYRDSPELQIRHDLMRAKLFGFMYRDNPELVLKRQYPASDQSFPAQYARAIATNFSDGLDAFLPKINALISAMPNNPYFYELKGQFLFEGGRASQAIPPLRTALKLHERHSWKSLNLRVLLGRTLVGADPKKYALEAIPLLQRGLSASNSNYLIHHAIGQAYRQVGRIDDSELSKAKYLFYRPTRNEQDKRKDVEEARYTAEAVRDRAGPGARSAEDFLSLLPKRK